ncbi:hypothetical protein GTO10_05910 [Candidatus Saccharibacteria bacterium]|nr:hypothetical protein [Candidatus Saccharibacteria bacterium]
MRVQKDTLKNGIRLLTVPMPHLGSAAVMIGIGAGSRYEQKEVVGIAHFTEHMLFKGTKRRPSSLAISSELESLGAQFNAFTTDEATAYYVKAAAKNLPKVLEILTDLVFSSKFDPKDISKEREVILEELKMYRDEPRSWVAHIYQKLMFGDHPLGRDPLGTPETLEAINRKDFLDYIGRWYRAKNIVVAVAGKIEGEQALGKTREVLGGLDGRDVGEPEVFKERQQEPAILIEERGTDQTHLILSARAYPRNHPKREALQILNAILGGGMSSRLFEEVRTKQGLAYYVTSTWDAYSDTGSLAIQAGVNNSRASGAIEVVLGELGKLKDKAVPKEELRKAKEVLRGSLLLGIESTNGACSYFLTQEVLDRKIETPQQKLKKIDAVTASDVQEVAKDIFVTRGLNLALIGPFSEPERFRKLLNIP